MKLKQGWNYICRVATSGKRTWWRKAMEIRPIIDFSHSKGNCMLTWWKKNPRRSGKSRAFQKEIWKINERTKVDVSKHDWPQSLTQKHWSAILTNQQSVSLLSCSNDAFKISLAVQISHQNNSHYIRVCSPSGGLACFEKIGCIDKRATVAKSSSLEWN